MLNHVVVLSLAAAAIAAPHGTVNERDLAPGVVEAFRAFAARDTLVALEKRQSDYSDALDAVEGLQSLLPKATRAASGGGECSSQCTPWVNSLTDCYSDSSSSQIQVGLCACSTDATQEMRVCGNCFGDDDLEDANDFRDYCRYATDVISSATSRSPSVTTRTSYSAITGSGYTSAVVRYSTETVSPSGTALPSGNLGGLDDIATSLRSGDATGAPAGGSSLGNPLEGNGDSGAGLVQVGACLVTGIASGAIALLAL